MKKYDVLVIGAGHAGLEASFACAKLGYETACITLSKKSVADAPCNPSIGGPAKGIVTREIDALGGMQGIVTDLCALQSKVLNLSKGPGVWAYRTQIDKEKYHKTFLNFVSKQKHLTLLEDDVYSIIVKNKTITGVITKNGQINTKKLIITAGTYLSSSIHVGSSVKIQGPSNFPTTSKLSINLKDNGFKLVRLKTGTPARICAKTFDESKTDIQCGCDQKIAFHLYGEQKIDLKKQLPCYLTYTNEKTHKIINSNLKKSAMYSGNISGTGPRYCPSIEDKVVRFSTKPRHQIFVEPMTIRNDVFYLQGLSTSLPKDVQDKMIHSIKGMEKAKVLSYGYAIEYDAIDPIQLKLSLESKLIKGLYFAGQINGTSGYEEAAGQGIIAGINASLAIKNKKPLVLKRSEAYIGVMIDDITTKGTPDPYRLLTSRAEYRLALRNDNVDDRLLSKGYKIGLIKQDQWKKYLLKKSQIALTIKYLKATSTKSLELEYKKTKSHTLFELLKQPKIKLKNILQPTRLQKLSDETITKIEILVKFSGYINHENQRLEKFNKNLNFKIDSIKNYNLIINLPLEAREKLNKVQPIDLNHASRVPGITINDLMIIKHYIETNNNE